MNAIVNAMLESAPVAWEELYNDNLSGLPSSNQDELRQELDAIAGRAAFLAEYISQRGGCHGCGKRDHKDAAKAARKQCVKVNKAIGYQYAERRAFNI